VCVRHALTCGAYDGAHVERSLVTPRTQKIVGGVALGLLVLVIVALLVLPGIARSAAKDRVRDRIGDDSAKVSVTGSWTTLIRGRADRVDVDTPTIATGTQDAPLGELLKDAKKVGEVDARVGQVQVQGLTLRDLHVIVKDQQVRATASLSIKSLTKLVPVDGATLKAIAPAADGSPRFAVTADIPLFGRQTVDAGVAATDGAVEVAAEGLPIRVAVTVFQDPSISVTSVTGKATGDRMRIAFTGAVN
jgi:hypothetical protein